MTPREPTDADLNGSASDADRDAHLREALRHAPDAEAAPPYSLSQLILARRKPRRAPRPRPPPRGRVPCRARSARCGYGSRGRASPPALRA